MNGYFVNITQAIGLKKFQRTKVSNSYSSWPQIIAGVPQGSILGPPVFNIFLNDLFLYPEETFLSNYADDNTLYSIGNGTIERVKKALSNNFRLIENWFHESIMVLNAKKCHYMCFRIGSENNDFIFDGVKLPNSCEAQIMSSNLIHILELCVKKQRKS